MLLKQLFDLSNIEIKIIHYISNYNDTYEHLKQPHIEYYINYYKQLHPSDEPIYHINKNFSNIYPEIKANLDLIIPADYITEINKETENEINAFQFVPDPKTGKHSIIHHLNKN